MAKGKSITITKEWLQSLGVTNVTEDGKVFYRDRELTQIHTTKHHKYGNDITYVLVAVYDKDLYQEQKKTRKIPLGQRYMLVSRIVYAWFNDVCPGGLDCDHIDNNPFNNSLSNLRLLTRKQNRGRSLPSNQHLCKLSEEDLSYYLDQNKQYKAEVTRTRNAWKKTAKELTDKHYHLEVIENTLVDKRGKDNKYLLHYYQKIQEEINILEDKIKQEKELWHNWVDKYNKFKQAWKEKMLESR